MPPVPQFPSFRKLSLDDISIFNEHLAKYRYEASEYIFTNFYIWRDCDNSQVTMLNGNLCVLAKPENEPAYFFEPIGNSKIKETIDEMLSHTPRLSRLSSAFVNANLKERKGLKIIKDDANSDYLYKREDLVLLKGRRFDGKRNRIKKLLRTSSPTYKKMDQGDIKGCLELLEEWKKSRTSGRCFDGPIREALENFKLLGSRGAVVIIQDKIKAFTIGEKLNKDTAVEYIEVATHDIDGLSQFINQQFCLHEWEDAEFINRESDMGDAGLRKAKLSYHPVSMVQKYSATLV